MSSSHRDVSARHAVGDPQRRLTRPAHAEKQPSATGGRGLGRPEPIVVNDDSSSQSTSRSRRLEKVNRRRVRRGKKPLTAHQFFLRKWLKRVGLALMLLLLGYAAFFAQSALSNLGKIVQGDLGGIFAKERLRQDADGRTNVLIFGISPEGWEGSDLADSIMVLSYKQDTGEAYTISLPRDLYVKHTCKAFLGTTAGKLNENYACGKKDAEAAGQHGQAAETAGQRELAKAAEAVLGLEIQYQVRANWKVLTDLVDAVGGIDVLVEAYDGSPVVHDVATKIRYKHGETVRLNGERALAFSRARGAFGGTGLSGGNFDRERNQQKILKAIVDKVKQTNKADLPTLTNLLNALGSNINTSFETKELQTLVDIAQKLDPSKITSIPLVDTEAGVSLMTTSNVGGASVVVPSAGTYSYRDIIAHVRKKMNPQQQVVEIEKPTIVVLNGAGVPGLAAQHQAKLTEQGLTVTQVGNFMGGRRSGHALYDLTNKSPQTLRSLAETYGPAQTPVPEMVRRHEADIVIVLGR